VSTEQPQPNQAPTETSRPSAEEIVGLLGELDAAMKAARDSKSAYIEVIGGRMDMPKGLAYAHTRLKELYGATP